MRGATNKGGRPPLPPGEGKVPLSLRAHPDELARLDELAGVWGVNRSEAIRRAVDLALANVHQGGR